MCADSLSLSEVVEHRVNSGRRKALSFSWCNAVFSSGPACSWKKSLWLWCPTISLFLAILVLKWCTVYPSFIGTYKNCLEGESRASCIEQQWLEWIVKGFSLFVPVYMHLCASNMLVHIYLCMSTNLYKCVLKRHSFINWFLLHFRHCFSIMCINGQVKNQTK